MPAPRGGFTPAGHPGMGTPAAHGFPAGAASPAQRSGFGASGSLFPPPGITSTRPVFFSNGIARYGTPERRGSRGGYGVTGVGFLNLGSPGYLDFGYDPDFMDPTYNPNTAPVGEGSGLLPDAVLNPQPPSMGGYGNYPEPGYPVYSGPGSPEQPGYPSEPGYRSQPEPAGAPENGSAPVPTPFLVAPARRAQPPPVPLPEEEAVTIIFKDGRPPEQIRNYALTRTALYVTAGRVRTIPVDDIDLAATEKINQKVGVDFQLPTR